MHSKDVKLGGRGEEALALVYRFNALTTAQYYLLAKPRDEEARENGSKSRGNPAGRRLAANAGLIRRWVEEGEDFAEVAVRMGVPVESVEAFARKRNLRERVAAGEEGP